MSVVLQQPPLGLMRCLGDGLCLSLTGPIIPCYYTPQPQCYERVGSSLPNGAETSTLITNVGVCAYPLTVSPTSSSSSLPSSSSLSSSSAAAAAAVAALPYNVVLSCKPPGSGFHACHLSCFVYRQSRRRRRDLLNHRRFP